MAKGKYAAEDMDIFDYQYYQIPGTDKSFRGPQPDPETSGEAISFLGAASCFGRFVQHPYAELVGKRLGRPVHNFGYGGARAAFYYSDPELMRLINRSAAVVLEIFSARGTGTSRIQSRTDASAFLRLAGDTAPFVFADQFFHGIWRTTPTKLTTLVAEIRQRYVEQMHSLLWRIHVPVVLLWFSQRAPDENADYENPKLYRFSFPHLVNRAMLDEIGQRRVTTVEVVSKVGLPQPLPERTSPTTGKAPRVNNYYPSPEMHQLAAERLVPALTRILERPKQPRPDPAQKMAADAAPAPIRRASVDPAPRTGPAKRDVLVHCHIFKNAGTSIDESLKRHFGTAWADVDLPIIGSCITNDHLVERLVTEPNVAAVSSHQMRFPLPGNDLIRLHPVVLLRHPIDRIRSMYDFERGKARQRNSQLLMTKRAAELSLPDWIEWRLDTGFHAQITNAQTRICSLRHNGLQPGDWSVAADTTNLKEALAIISELAVVGIVDEFECTIAALTAHFAPLFPGLNFLNVQQNRSPRTREIALADRLEVVRKQLGPPLYQRLLHANELDIELYSFAKRRLLRQFSSTGSSVSLPKSDRRTAAE